jgi:hypothetical protein
MFGKTETHFPNFGSDEYATACGLDGDDPNEMVDQKIIQTPKGAKVNCSLCAEIFYGSRKASEKDIEPHLRRAP